MIPLEVEVLLVPVMKLAPVFCVVAISNLTVVCGGIAASDNSLNTCTEIDKTCSELETIETLFALKNRRFFARIKRSWLISDPSTAPFRVTSIF
jgi:hypothetical protein